MKFKLLFILIIALSAFLRLWQLGAIPISLDWDEASLGYNAYSILRTGKDEYGEFLPLTIRSFGDYKPALYVYLITPFMLLFGLSDLAVRLPSAILGIAAVAATFYLVKELLEVAAKRMKHTQSADILGESSMWTVTALLSAALLAISPWHIQFSRVAFEANAAIAFNILGLLFFLKGLKRNPLLWLSPLFFGLGIYTYQSEKVFVPLLAILLLVLFRRELLKVPRVQLSVAAIIGVVMILPFMLSIIFDANSLSRARGVSVFSHNYPAVEKSINRMIENRREGDVLGLVLDNRRIEYAKIVLSNYLAHFNPKWLFVHGDSIARHHAPSMGNLYIWELPFIAVGLFVVLFSSLKRKAKMLIFGWLLLVPVPAAIAWDVPSSVRTLNFLPLFQIFAAVGLVRSYLFIKDELLPGSKFQLHRSALYAVFGLIGIGSFVYYLNQYFSQYNYFASQDWQYGYKEAVSYVDHNQHKYSSVVVSDTFPLDQSYIFFLYHLQYPPSQYHKDVQSFTNGNPRAFGAYTFERIDSSKMYDSNTLFVGTSGDMFSGTKKIETIQYLDGGEGIVIFKN